MDSFIVYIKADNIYKDIAEDAEIRFDTSNYELDRPFPKGKIKKVIGLMEDKLSGKIMIRFVELRAKTDSYLLITVAKIKKQKAEKVCHKKKTLNLKIINTVQKQLNLKIK